MKKQKKKEEYVKSSELSRVYEDGKREGERRLLWRLVEELLEVNLDPDLKSLLQ